MTGITLLVEEKLLVGTTSKPWGWHLMINAKAGMIPAISNKDVMRAFIAELVLDIDMVAFGDPWIERFATHDEFKAGISFCQMIETSNICGHFVESSGDFYLDIFSCKPFDEKIVLKLVQDYFHPIKLESQMLERSAPE